VRDWWRRWPDSNVGVVISDLPVIVLDVDGPLGEVSLQTLLDQAGSTALPETYTVTTGRTDGGRHLWYRLTDQQAKLVNQLGAHYPQTPHLDVLFQGLVVGAGSLHKTGATYVGDSSLPPPPSELAELPMMFFQPLARRGKRRDEPGARTRAKKPRKSAPAAQGPAVVAPEGFTPPPGVRTLLADESDGRNGRTLQAVTPLVRLGWPEEVIINTVLASPLGSKAREQRDPKWWIRQKIETARGVYRSRARQARLQVGRAHLRYASRKDAGPRRPTETVNTPGSGDSVTGLDRDRRSSRKRFWNHSGSDPGWVAGGSSPRYAQTRCHVPSSPTRGGR